MGGSSCPFLQLDVLQLDPHLIMSRQRGNILLRTQHGHHLKVSTNRHPRIPAKTLFTVLLSKPAQSQICGLGNNPYASRQ